MKKKIAIVVAAVVVLFIVARVIYGMIAGDGKTVYQFGEITKGDLESTISSNGTLSPLTTVEVGTQVSGTIARLYVDFNDYVKKGELLAVLDTVLLKAAVLDAEANLDKSEALLGEAQANYERNQPLFEQNLISEAEFVPYQTNLKTQKANLMAANASMLRAQLNLKYALIRSPISGTVIGRSVEEGQTVAASFSTPTLFVIAEDLSRMEILAEVDEADIGQIKQGQSARFDVQAYADKIFTAEVKQIRLKPTTVSNVVTYTVVLEAANSENLLLPGMTATVDFIVAEKHEVLLVPNTALRFTPPEEELTRFRERRRKEFESMPDSLKERGRGFMQNRMGGQGGPPGNGKMPSDLKQIWYLDQNGKLSMEMVKVGTTNGTLTEIVRGRNVTEGMKVITGAETTGDSKKSSSSSSAPGFGPGRRPMF
jgi:HlyD family secretion protein